MASESKKRKTPKFPVKGKDKFLSNRRSSKGAGGYNSSKRQDVKNSTKKEVEKEIADMKNEIVSCSEFIKEEFFGGPSSALLLPRLDSIINKLNEIRGKVENEIGDAETRKIEPMWNYIVNNMDLEMLATSKRISDELKKELLIR